MITAKDIDFIAENPHVLGHLVGKEKLTPLHSDWIKYIWATDEDRALQAHRGSYKTTSISAIGPVWWWIFNPEDRIGLIRKSFSDAADVGNTIATIMETPIIKEIFKFVHGMPLKFRTRQYGKLNFSFKQQASPEGSFTALGLNGGITGKHFDRILLDDFVTLEDRISKAEREKTKEILREIMNNIIDPGKPVSFIGTPWHRDDAWTIVPVTPAKFNVDRCQILTPELIAEKKRKTTPFLYAANYELKLDTDKSKMFQDPTLNVPWDFRDGTAYAHLDASYDGNHYSALTIMAKKKNGRIQAVGFTDPGNVKDWLAHIKKMYRKYYVSTLYNETNPDKGYTADSLETTDSTGDGIDVTRYAEKRNKHIKISTHLYEAWDLIDWAPETDKEYLNQILDYSEGMEPDDAPDSAASLLAEIFTPTVKGTNDALYKW